MGKIFEDIARGLVEAICLEHGLLKTEEVDGMPAKTSRIVERLTDERKHLPEEVERELMLLLTEEELCLLYDTIGYKPNKTIRNQKIDIKGIEYNFTFDINLDRSEIKYQIPRDNESFKNYVINGTSVFIDKGNRINIAA